VTIFLSEADAQKIIHPTNAFAAMKLVFEHQAQHKIENYPRQRRKVFDKSLNITMASDQDTERYAIKIYGGGSYHIYLYDKYKSLLAVMEADWLGQLRTAATCALAAAYVGVPPKSHTTIIGAGRHARAQLLALDAAGLLGSATVYARNKQSLNTFCQDVKAELSCPLTPSTHLADDIARSRLIVTATTSETPVLSGHWLAPHTHITAMGANAASRRELDADTIKKASLLICDDPEQAKNEAGEFREGVSEGYLQWSDIKPLHALVANKDLNTKDEALTIFKSLGAGLEDLAIASLLYDEAMRI